ncbi:hypothetical protein L211DRAFT_843333 [Terfezia boudieri ATCC MYA-4762]|uniref:Uncharacterized protein n=1 Tax=Terfezia boudieri ATCC MYA-4762 TaxID=1051890 RepID=A0A3N4L729_9PEZI|nr:hypothetical protein L211DRAFT_843333 [Terfezia boudieri ATCC MYA-4762]
MSRSINSQFLSFYLPVSVLCGEDFCLFLLPLILPSCLVSGHTIFWPTPSTLASRSSIHGAGAGSSLLNWY